MLDGRAALLNGNAWPPLPPECDNALTAFAFLRTIRLLRVVRVLKLGNFSAGVKVFSIAIGKSTPQLVAILFFMVLTMVVSSSAMYYVEQAHMELTATTRGSSRSRRRSTGASSR